MGSERPRCSFMVDPRVDAMCGLLAGFEVHYRIGSHFDYPKMLYRCDLHLTDTVGAVAQRSDNGVIDAVRRVEPVTVVRKAS